MGRQLILAHDLGTSGDKACLFDVEGNFLAEAYYTYPTFYPAPGWYEHDPETWWSAVKNSSKEVMKNAGAQAEEVKAISFSAHGMGAIPVDKEGRLLVDKVMIWNDARSTEEAAYILEKSGEREHYEKTGNSFDLALYPAAKLLWIKKNMPDVYKQAYKFISTKEFLINRMTGVIKYTDYGEAGMSGLFNLKTHKWDDELLKISEVDEEKLLIPTDASTVMGELLPDAAEEMGLRSGIPVVLGSWDNYACATGAGVRSGSMAVCLGTAGWLGKNHDKPIMTPDNMTNVVYVGDNTYFTSIHSHSAGASYDWVIDKLCSYLKQDEDPLAYAEKLAAEVSPGADKLFFLPSMFSGNTFYSSSALCGSMVGMKVMQENGNVIRAAMEGVGFDLMMGAELMRQEGAMPEQCSLFGGGAHSQLWGQILASMFESKMMRPKNLQYIGALGATLLAGVGTGIIKDFQMAAQITQSDDISLPDPDETAVYRKLLPIYKEFYEQLMPVYKELQDIQL